MSYISYRMVSQHAQNKPFRISIKQLSGDMIELGSDPGDTIGNVGDFLAELLMVQRSRIVLMNDDGVVDDREFIQSNIDLNIIIRNEFPELYQLTQNPLDVLHLGEEFERLIGLGEDPVTILEDFVNGWQKNIIEFQMLFIPNQTLEEIRDHSIDVITNAPISHTKKKELIDRILSYNPYIDPYVDQYDNNDDIDDFRNIE